MLFYYILLYYILLYYYYINIYIYIIYIHMHIHIDQAHEVFYVQCHVPEPSSTNVCCTLRLAQTCVGLA